jgi:hypothetical protein
MHCPCCRNRAKNEALTVSFCFSPFFKSLFFFLGTPMKIDGFVGFIPLCFICTIVAANDCDDHNSSNDNVPSYVASHPGDRCSSSGGCCCYYYQSLGGWFFAAHHELSHWSWLVCAGNAILHSRRDSPGKSSHDSQAARIGRTLARHGNQEEIEKTTNLD